MARIKLVSDIHGAAEALAREAAGADALLVCGDLVNLIDYRTMEGIAAEVFGPEATRDFVRHRTAGRFEEAGQVLRSAAARFLDQVQAAVRAQYEAVFAAFPEPTYLTHGNVDRPEQFQDLLRPGIRHLDGETVEVDGMRVGFVGGGLPRGERPHLSEITHEAFAAKVAAVGPDVGDVNVVHAVGRGRDAGPRVAAASASGPSAAHSCSWRSIPAIAITTCASTSSPAGPSRAARRCSTTWRSTSPTTSTSATSTSRGAAASGWAGPGWSTSATSGAPGACWSTRRNTIGPWPSTPKGPPRCMPPRPR